MQSVCIFRHFFNNMTWVNIRIHTGTMFIKFSICAGMCPVPVGTSGWWNVGTEVMSCCSVMRGKGGGERGEERGGEGGVCLVESRISYLMNHNSQV